MTPEEKSLIGATIAGKYRIEGLIGTGAMGVVCKARHLELGKRVAIKLIESSIAGNADVARRFRREARAASIVESDHIVQVFDVGEDPQHGLFMVMEHLIGEDLSARLARETLLDVDTTVKIIYQVSRALAKAHAAGVVHRDLKPANVFLVDKEDKSIFVKVLDFGISKMLGQESLAKSGQLQLTRAGSAIGTPQYASPEQAQGLLDVDQTTDIWSLGVMLYEMLAGAPAYKEMPTYEQFIIQLVTTQPEPLTKIAPWVPPPLAAVAHAAIKHNPKERIRDCDTFARLIIQAAPKLASQRGPMRSFPDLAPAPATAPAKLPSPAIADDTVQMPPLSEDIDVPPPSGRLTDPTQGIAYRGARISDAPPSSDAKTTIDASPFETSMPTPPAAISVRDDLPTLRRGDHGGIVASGSGPHAAQSNIATASRVIPPPRALAQPWIAIAIVVGIVLMGVIVGVAILLLRGKGSV